MALTFATLKLFQSGTDDDVFIVPTAFTPPANTRLLLAIASNRNAATPSAPSSIVGNSLTWTAVDDQPFHTIASPVSRLHWYQSKHASPTSGTVTITFPEVQQCCCAIMMAVATTIVGSEVVIGTPVAGVSDATDTLGVTLPAFAASTNGAVYAVAKVSTSGMAPKAGWFEQGEQGSTSPALRLHVQRLGSEDTAPSCTWAPSADAAAAGIGFELKESVIAQPSLIWMPRPMLAHLGR